MGGLGSGRPATRPSLWSLYSVRTKQIREACGFRPGMVGSITFDDGTRIEVGTTGEIVTVNGVVVPITWTRPHLGGRRAWFRCPNRACGRRCAVIYGRGTQWACQRCWNGNYPSQKEDPFDRMIRRAGKLRRRLGETMPMAPIDHVEMAGWPPDKPPRIHRRTYDRLVAELHAVEARAAELYREQLCRLVGRLDPDLRETFA